MLFFPKTHNPSLIMRKTSDKSEVRIVYNIHDQYASKFSKSLKTNKQKKDWETVVGEKRRHNN